jgi:hypothetical protein
VGDVGEKIKEELESLASKAQEFPEKAKDALSNSEMNPFEILKAVHAVAMNVKVSTRSGRLWGDHEDAWPGLLHFVYRG